MMQRAVGQTREKPTTPSDAFEKDVLEGLSRRRKSLPARYFYDTAGSRLFEKITELPEYYLTRSEIEILTAHGESMTAGMESGGALVELGSGSSTKTEILLANRGRFTSYVPIDVSRSALDGAIRRIGERFPEVEVLPVFADFRERLELPERIRSRPVQGFFPGSTIGNFTPAESVALLAMWRGMLGPEARLLIGVDLKKDADRLVAAYDDDAGVTAAFNRNILHRINRELSGTLDPSLFRHIALYNSREGRIEMHLASLATHDAEVAGRRIRFRKGETIHTESSYKYAPAEFQELARRAGWQAVRVWQDDRRLFSVHELA